MHYLRVLGICAVALAIGACAKIPQAEIDAARSAVAAAIADNDVLTYAPDSLRAAQEKLSSLDAELAAQQKKSPVSRAYDRSVALAKEAVTAAHVAQSDAQVNKQQAARDAAALIEKIRAAIPEFEMKVWAARRVKGIKLDAITSLSLLVDEARLALNDARKDLDSGSFAAARAKAMAIQDWLAQGVETITEQTRIAKSR